MKTNFEMIRELDKEFTPETRGIVHMKEIYQINKALCLDEMDVIALRNIRDFTVMFYNMKMEDGGFDRDIHDKMSAIVSVIDNKLWNMGAEV